MTKAKSGSQRLRRNTGTPLREAMSRNLILKLVCLALAFAVWQSIRENTSFEAVVTDVPVKITAGDGLAILDQSTDVVNVRFRGSREDLRFLSRDQVTVEVDLAGHTDRLRQTIRLTPRYVKAPSRAHAVFFEPAEVSVTIDREVERTLPVKAALEDKLPEGIEIEKVVCIPASVKVRGAERLLQDIEQIRTAPISLDGRYHPFKTHAAVVVPGQSWKADPDRVLVELNLIERVVTQRVENIYVRPLLTSDDSRVVKIRPEKVTLILRGSPQRIADLNLQEVYAYIDCSQLTEPAQYDVPVRADLPFGVQVDTIEPAVVQVVVKKM